MTVFEQLVLLCDPLIVSYRTDLLVHDRAALDRNPGVPFLHWTRDMGTHLQFLWPAESHMFPPEGEFVPYLFGRCDRNELAHKPQEVAEAMQVTPGVRLTLHYDGQKLRKITPSKAREIATDYCRHLRAAWRKNKHESGTHPSMGVPIVELRDVIPDVAVP